MTVPQRYTTRTLLRSAPEKMISKSLWLREGSRAIITCRNSSWQNGRWDRWANGDSEILEDSGATFTCRKTTKNGDHSTGLVAWHQQSSRLANGPIPIDVKLLERRCNGCLQLKYAQVPLRNLKWVRIFIRSIPKMCKENIESGWIIMHQSEIRINFRSFLGWFWA
jgi:hypothetical protein